MKELGQATEDEMVLAFLRAEIDSTRFGLHYKNYLDQLRPFGITRETLLDYADLTSSRDNAQRIEILKAVRGYRNNSLLFRGFPNDVTWRRVGLEPADWISVKYVNHPTWLDLSGQTRAVADGAKNIDAVRAAEDAATNIKAIASELRRGNRYPELIAASDDNGKLILIEGHSRATAYALTPQVELVEVIVGYSPTMARWRFY